MAKRIVMIPPFDVLTGNLSGGQDLKYAQNNNPAFDAPEGKVNYARNYKPRYIGSKRGSDGLTYFSVRQRNGVKVNTQTKLAMALLGGAGALRAAILRDETVRTLIEQQYEWAIEAGDTNASFSKWVFEFCYRGLQRKSAAITFYVTGHGNQNVYNPWVYTNQQATGHHVNVGNDVLVKFWPQLATNPITFTVEGQKGVAHAEDAFSTIFDRRYNVLGLKAGEGTYTNNVALGDMYLAFSQGGTEYGAYSPRPILHNGAPSIDTLDYHLTSSALEPWSD